MDVHIYAERVIKVGRYDSKDADRVMVSLGMGTSSACFFVSKAQADTLFPALQKVYENVQEIKG